MSGAPANRPFTVLVAVSVLSLLLGLYLALSGRGGMTFSNGADSFSRSLLGHSGLVDLLRELDVTVHVGRTPPRSDLPERPCAISSAGVFGRSNGASPVLLLRSL